MLVFALSVLGLFVIVTGRYLAVSGGLYWWCWIHRREALQARRIDPPFPPAAKIRTERRWSLLTCVIFAISGSLGFVAWQHGYTQIYLRIDDYGWPYFFASIALLALLHDTYFYWTHRWMHRPRVFRRVHWVHHLSVRPSPWAAFSFHWTEAWIEALILPALIFVVPAHPAALLVLLTFMTICGTVNHLGYELFPAWFARHPITRYFIGATHHQMHHRWVRCNYGLYFTFWDRLMGTEHPDYSECYDRVHEGRGAFAPQLENGKAGRHPRRAPPAAAGADTGEVNPEQM